MDNNSLQLCNLVKHDGKVLGEVEVSGHLIWDKDEPKFDFWEVLCGIIKKNTLLFDKGYKLTPQSNWYYIYQILNTYMLHYVFKKIVKFINTYLLGVEHITWFLQKILENKLVRRANYRYIGYNSKIKISKF